MAIFDVLFGFIAALIWVGFLFFIVTVLVGTVLQEVTRYSGPQYSFPFLGIPALIFLLENSSAHTAWLEQVGIGFATWWYTSSALVVLISITMLYFVFVKKLFKSDEQENSTSPQKLGNKVHETKSKVQDSELPGLTKKVAKKLKISAEEAHRLNDIARKESQKASTRNGKSSASVSPAKKPLREFDRWKNLDGSPLSSKLISTREGSFGAVVPVKQLNYGPKKNITLYGAIKILKSEKVSEQEYAAFREEANKLAEIGKHPNVAFLLDWPKKKREKWFVMEMVGSRNLGDLCGRVSGPELLGYAKDIFSGLAEVHSKRMVHFDLKPHNIGVRDDGNSCALLDFGLSFTPRKELPKYLTTPEYAAPELFGKFNPSQGYAADVYSAAITLMHLASGNVPWKNSRRNMSSLIDEITTRGPMWTGINNPGLREFLKPLIHFDPQKRPTAVEVLAHLQSKSFNAWPKGSKYAGYASELDAIRSAKFGN